MEDGSREGAKANSHQHRILAPFSVKFQRGRGSDWLGELLWACLGRASFYRFLVGLAALEYLDACSPTALARGGRRKDWSGGSEHELPIWGV